MTVSSAWGVYTNGGVWKSSKPVATKYTTVTTFPSKSSNRVYTVKRDSECVLSCDCPGWIYNKSGMRTCKHTDPNLLIWMDAPSIAEVAPAKRVTKRVVMPIATTEQPAPVAPTVVEVRRKVSWENKEGD